ncbi:hypothetical protein Cgig2_022792 [Carnegiea gigantea]|uniref:Uncharacterized protein n=1 Tax=Carnegiea gigantea TaxID=171969 RepID=A0A9Q1KBC8_9CARY|nr:hypothetical protein Cgig2_022792 [Carnegiea gigantea]
MDQNWYWKPQWSIYNLVNGRVFCVAEQIFSRGENVQGKKAVEVVKDVMRKEPGQGKEIDLTRRIMVILAIMKMKFSALRPTTAFVHAAGTPLAPKVTIDEFVAQARIQPVLMLQSYICSLSGNKFGYIVVLSFFVHPAVFPVALPYAIGCFSRVTPQGANGMRCPHPVSGQRDTKKHD